MKIQQIHINRFGHFHESDLVFAGDGLQVIYGPNEAGKTTLLEFLRGLLFDFPARTPYDFGGSGDAIAGSATMRMKDGRIAELRRRKGLKDKLHLSLNGPSAPIEEAAWLRLLDGADRDLFRSVFAFGIGDLSLGEESLKHESLQSALFAGGLGGVSSPDEVIGELTKQADDLFKKAGTKPAINVRLAEIKRLTKEIKDGQLRSDNYHDCKVALAKAAEDALRLREEVEQLRRAHTRIEKLVRAWPKWWQLQQKIQERQGLVVPAKVPQDARQNYSKLAESLKALEREQAKQKQDIEVATQGLASLNLDPTAIRFQSEIKSCLELRQSYVEARHDLPELRQQRELEQKQIERELADTCPHWSQADLREHVVDLAARAQIDQAIDAYRQRTTHRTKLLAKRDSDVLNLERARDELSDLGEPADVSLLQASLADESDDAANRKQLENTNGDLIKLERKIARQIQKLVPPLSDTASDIHLLPVPRIETINNLASRLNDLQMKLQSLSESIAEDEGKHRSLSASLDAELSSRAVPSLAERESARRHRDQGWTLIRQKYVLRDPSDAEIKIWMEDEGAINELPSRYEQAVIDADEISDKIYENANEVARREELTRQLAEMSSQIEAKKQRAVELQRHLDQWQEDWCKVWQPCGLSPLQPDAMLGWIKDHEAACLSIADRDVLTRQQTELTDRIAAFEQRLRSVFPGSQDFSSLLASARQAVETSKQQQLRKAELQKEVRRLEKLLQKYDAELAEVDRDESEATKDWQTMLRLLNFPDHWGMELAREVIDKLNATRVRLEGLPKEDHRIAAMQDRIKEFERQVHSLCQSLHAELLRDPPELAIKKLDEQFERALEAQRKHDDYSIKRTTAETQLKRLDEQIAKGLEERSRWFELAGVKTDEDFFETVSRAEAAIRLDQDIDQLQREIALIRAGEPQEEFEKLLSSSEESVLQGQERDLAEQLRSAEEARRKADGHEAVVRSTLNAMDGSENGARLNEQLSRQRSMLAADLDRYMPLIYARHLLRTAVNRFEKENQPAMIAKVSQLLSLMTAGRYSQFDRMGSGKHNMLIRRDDGVELTPEQLSTGTREQLYLSIRLAYVLDYCENHEPLPIVVDDVLVNFDEERSRQTLRALMNIAEQTQVLFFTCHRHMVELARDIIPGLVPIHLESSRKTSTSTV